MLIKRYIKEAQQSKQEMTTDMILQLVEIMSPSMYLRRINKPITKDKINKIEFQKMAEGVAMRWQ
ncbi:MAG: hypothetical protein IJ635_00505 [Bacteroidaceae bacterium]|nr:hypothetical protein [Bacteroidaceae bacterium]